MTTLKRGDVFLVDLGYVAKVRPCVIVSITQADSRRNMSVVAPLTTQSRGGECEVDFPKPAWLNEHAVINLIGRWEWTTPSSGAFSVGWGAS